MPNIFIKYIILTLKKIVFRKIIKSSRIKIELTLYIKRIQENIKRTKGRLYVLLFLTYYNPSKNE